MPRIPERAAYWNRALNCHLQTIVAENESEEGNFTDPKKSVEGFLHAAYQEVYFAGFGEHPFSLKLNKALHYKQKRLYSSCLRTLIEEIALLPGKHQRQVGALNSLQDHFKRKTH